MDAEEVRRRPFLLVGESPNKHCAGRPRLWLLPVGGGRNNAAARLLDASGMTLRQYLRAFDRANLCRGLPPRDGKGRKFPMATARREARRLLRESDHDGVVVLGKRVARAFGLKDPPWLEWVSVSGSRMAVVPHPSGVNRFYNDAANRAAVERFFKEQVVEAAPMIARH